MSYNISTGIFENEFELNTLITNNANSIELIEIVNNEQQNDIDSLQTDVYAIKTCNITQQQLINSLQTDVIDIETCNAYQQQLINSLQTNVIDIETCNAYQELLINSLQTNVIDIETCNITQQQLINSLQTNVIDIETCNITQQQLINSLQTNVIDIETCNVNQQQLINSLQTNVIDIENCNVNQQDEINGLTTNLVNTSNELIEYTKLNLETAKNYADTQITNISASTLQSANDYSDTLINNHQQYFDINTGNPQLINYITYTAVGYSPITLENKLTLNDNDLIYKAYQSYDFTCNVETYNIFKISNLDEFIKFETINNKLVLLSQNSTQLLWQDDDKIWVKAIDNNEDDLRESVKIIREVRSELTALQTASAISDILSGVLTVAGWLGSAFVDGMTLASIASLQSQIAGLGISVAAVSGANQSAIGYDILTDFVDNIETIDPDNIAQELENRNFSQEDYQKVVLRYIGHMLRCYQYNVKHNFLPYPGWLDDYNNLIFKRGLGGGPPRFDDDEDIKTIIYDKTGITNNLFVSGDIIYDCTFDGNDAQSNHQYFINGASLKTKMTSIDTAISQINNKTTDEIQEGNNNLYSQWNDTGNNIYYNAGNVGIGTNSPAANLHIYDAGNPHLLLEDGFLDNQLKIEFKSGNYDYVFGLHGGENKMKVSEGNTFGTNDLLILDSVGNFDVVGNVNIPDGKTYKINGNDLQYSDLANLPEDFDTSLSNAVDGTTITYTGGTLTAVGGGGSSQWTTAGNDIYYSTGNVGIGIATPAAKLHTKGEVRIQGTNNTSHFYYGTNNDVYIRSGTNNVDSRVIIADNSTNTYVGIGTRVPANKLDVNGDFSVNRTNDPWSSSPNPSVYMRFNGVDDVGHIQCIKRSNLSTYPLKFYASKYSFELGNVGIGTTSPSRKLHVYGKGGFTDCLSIGQVSKDVVNNINSVPLRVSGLTEDTGGEILICYLDNNDYAGGSPWEIGKITFGMNEAMDAATNVNGPSSSLGPPYSSIKNFASIKTLTQSNGAIRGNIVFSTSDEASTGGATYPTSKIEIERMRIAYNGNVGIGITTPAAKLDVLGDFSVNRTTDPWSTSPNPAIYMKFSTHDESGYIQSIKRQTLTKYPLVFEASKFNIKSGNLGIDTYNPEGKLHVNGDIIVGKGETTRPAVGEDYRLLFFDFYRQWEFRTYNRGLDLQLKTTSSAKSFYITNRYDQPIARFYGRDDNAGTNTSWANIFHLGINKNPNSLYKLDVNGSANIDDNLIVNHNVGIGTVPQEKLHIHNGNVKIINGVLLLSGTFDNTIDKGIFLDTNYDSFYKQIQFAKLTGAYDRKFYMGTYGDDSAYIKNSLAVAVDGGGGDDPNLIWVWYSGKTVSGQKFGVKVNNPLYDIDVLGDINCSGNYRIGGNPIDTDDIVQGTNNLYSQWSTSGTKIYYNAGNVGIGITNPSEKLHVNGSCKLDNTIIRKYGGTNNDWTEIKHASLSSYNISMKNDGEMWLNVPTSKNMYFLVNGTKKMVLDSSGNVGIGKNNPASKLDVNGSIRAAFDNNTTSYFGRSAVGYCGHNDHASFCHINRNNTTDYGLLCNPNGLTYLNCANNQSIRFRVANSDKMIMTSSGRFGIATSNPIDKLHVYGNIRLDNGGIFMNGTGSSRALHINKWLIYQASGDFNNYGDQDQNDLVFSYRPNDVIQDPGFGFIQHDDIYIDFIDFTGQHRAVSKNKDLYDKKYIGYIVSSIGEYKDLNSQYKNQNRNIKINSALPYINLSNKHEDKSCFGVISDCEEDNKRTYHSAGVFKSSYKQHKSDKRVIINSLGEGAIWVSNFNGNIQNGDYITTSPINGIGMRQNSDSLKNYTVAKATCSIDFDNIQSYPLEKVKQEYIYTSNIEISTSNIQTSNLIYTSNYDESNVLYITSNIEISNQEINVSNIIVKSNLENCLSNGDLIYEIQYDDNSNIIYEPEYDFKYIKLDGTIIDYNQYNSNVDFIMCMIGATYHCG